MASDSPLVGDWYGPDSSGIGHGCTVQADLSLGDTDIDPPGAFTQPTDVLKRVSDDPHKYSDNVPGRVETREAIRDAWLCNDRLAESIPVDETADGSPCIVVTPGGQAAVHHAVNATLSTDEHALLIEPYYPYHAKSVRLFSDKQAVTTVATDATEGFQPDLDLVRQTIEDNPVGTVVLCSPSNPTGARYDENWLKGLAKTVTKQDITVVSDEVYAFMTYGDDSHRSIATFPGMDERTLVIGSFSKVFGVSGWRLGFVRCPIEFLEPLREVTDCIAMQSATPAQVLLEAALRTSDPMAKADVSMERLERRLDVLIEPFKTSKKITVHRPEGAFYLLPTVSEAYQDNISGLSEFDSARAELPDGLSVQPGDCLYHHLLEEAEVEGVPGRAFGNNAADAVRLAFGQTPESELVDAAGRIETALERF